MKLLFIGLVLLSSFSVMAADLKKSKLTKIGTQEDGKKAADALNEILRAYESGNTNYLRAHLSPKMIGLQKVLDDVTVEASKCKQMRLNLLNTQIQAGPDVAVIQSSWEKRCLQLPNFTAKLYTGQATFLMENSTDGWTMTGVSGTSPLANSASR